MRKLLLLSSIIAMAFAHFDHHGHFSDMIETRDLSSRVDISTLNLDTKGTYAVGAIADAKGEITIYDGEVFLSYGKSGVDKVYKTIPKNTDAMLLAVIRPQNFSQEITIENNIDDLDFYFFGELEKIASKHGIDLDQPFLYILTGSFDNLLWHVIDGKNHELKEGETKPKLMKKLFVDTNNHEGIIFGVYEKGNEGVFTHPGEYFHAHGIFNDGNQAGHVDRFSIKSGTTLQLAQ